ncbi:alpha/beta hydrolase family protein [Acanthopleuribacter pedis]|uniref:Alpha/beta fold hydrolase n=1 Tax=Acanthopleuribacter pedis TaxID=442870 RepID=A0A8J7QEC6_9BACT|nr:alpha/beta fold hydrolase [Acanthopleuribacter pedis]MBO1322339.1 alpha/beta fold hydrolase [Acanthopleuribacter pedis]
MSLFEQCAIKTEDDFPLVARFFEPEQAAVGTIVIAPAMGVGQKFYQDFAEWLQGQNYRVVTFDYRGIGFSRYGSLRGLKADIFTWAQKDCGAVLAEIKRRGYEDPLTWIGHSLGGQILPLVPNHEMVRKMVTVATGSGYWRENSPSLKRMVWWLWYFLVPLSLPLFGYFPGKRFRKVGDLPKGVMAQWRRWCMNREYSVGVEGDAVRDLYASVQQPITSLSFEDDQYMSLRNTESIHSFYRGSDLCLKRLSPKDTDGQAIGHFGFFRAKFKESLWRAHLLPELQV